MPDLVKYDNINRMIKLTVITLSGSKCIIKTTKTEVLFVWYFRTFLSVICPIHSKTKFDIEVKLVDANENENIFFCGCLQTKQIVNSKKVFFSIGSMLR
jgi:hypothetical protein